MFDIAIVKKSDAYIRIIAKRLNCSNELHVGLSPWSFSKQKIINWDSHERYLINEEKC